jgi:hypothetical protein
MIKRKYCHSLYGHRESNPKLLAAIGQIIVYRKPLEVVRGTPCWIIGFFGEWVITSAMNWNGICISGLSWCKEGVLYDQQARGCTCKHAHVNA